MAEIILSFVVFLFSLTLHEAAHAWTSDLFGDSTGRYLGRISLNPMVHIDPIGTILLPLIGAFTGVSIIGWAKPVPVNPNLWRDKVKANILVSAAGPAANLLIAIVAAAIVRLISFIGSNHLGAFEKPVLTLLSIAVMVNVMLAVFNMLPIPPLDGSHVLSSVLSLVSTRLMEAYETTRPYGFLVLLLLIYTGVLRSLLQPVVYLVMFLLLA
ncbi:MAG: site-2 protease family protein [Acidobacteriota bacterium]|nr:site-2 protease family protein [Blastocatellia bacterium]MDW8412459.1 site-2 protease family protein [Acidobacteriota bacterium]